MVLVESGRRLRERRTRHVYDARLSGVHYSTKLFAEKCGYLLARKVGFGCFCFASSGAQYPRLVFHAPPRVLYSEEEKKSWKSTKLSKQREQRSRRGKRDILFERFSLKFLKGNFSASKERNKQHFRHYRTQHHHRTHNIIYKNGIRDEVTNQRRFQKSRTGEENGHSGEEGTFLNAHRSRGVGFVRNPSASSSSHFRRKKRRKRAKKKEKTQPTFSPARDE